MKMTFTPKTIYKDLMRCVHPDLHPNMVDATAKAQQVNAVKNNAQALRMLAISWGFIKPALNDMARMNQRTFTNRTYQRPTYQPPRRIQTLNDIQLVSSRSYVGQNIYVKTRIHGKEAIYRVIRTTAKCVVVDFYGVQKVVRIKNIISRVNGTR